MDPSTLQSGVEAFVQRLGALSASNEELQRRLELQRNEVSTLEAMGVSQQQLLKAFGQRVDEVRQFETDAADARARANSYATERRLRMELDECRELLRASQAECDEQRRRNGESASELRSELRLLREELNRGREELSKEKEARLATERLKEQAIEKQRELQASLGHAVRQAGQLQSNLVDQQQLVQHREDQCAVLEARLRSERSKARELLERQKEKVEIVSRLDGVLPRSTLLKAID